MTHKINNILNGITKAINTPSIDATDFVTRANDSSLLILEGTIESLYILNDSVFAVIRKNEGSTFSPSGDLVDHGDSLFNGSDGVPNEDMTVPEIAVLTNIDASNNKLSRYIGKTAKVVVKNNVAVFAEVNLGLPTISIIPANLIRKVRTAIAGQTTDLFSDIGKKYFKDEGYTDEDIQALSEFKYVEAMTSKINTFEGEALWFKDTAGISKDENIIPTNDILVGLNKLGMKTKKCHIPSRLFSGK